MDPTPPEITEMTSVRAKLSWVTRDRKMVSKFMISPTRENQSIVKEAYTSYEDRVHTFVEAFSQVENSVTGDNKIWLQKWFEPHQLDHIAFKTQVEAFLILRQIEDICPKDSISNVFTEMTRASQKSSTSSARARVALAEKRAKITAKIATQGDQQQLDQQQMKQRRVQFEFEQNELHLEHKREQQALNDKKERIEIEFFEKELDQLDGISGDVEPFTNDGNPSVNPVLSNLNIDQNFASAHSGNFAPGRLATSNLVQSGMSQNNFVESGFPQNNFVPDNLPQASNTWSGYPNTNFQQNNFVHPYQNQGVSDPVDMADIVSRSVMKAQSYYSLPSAKIKPFSGENPLQYYTFIRMFESFIESKCLDDAEKFTHLMSATTGKAYEIVESYSRRDLSLAFRAAKQALMKKYGNEYETSRLLLKKLDNWPNIKNEDGPAMSQLAEFLFTCANYMEDMPSLCQLNSHSDLRTIQAKLPVSNQNSWRKRMTDLHERGILVKFGHMVEFVKRQAAYLEIPIFNSVSDNKSQNIKCKMPYRKNRSFVASSNNPERLIDSRSVQKCEFCGLTNHIVQTCFKFCAKDKNERVQFIRDHHLCFKCLKKGHAANKCIVKLKCNKCCGPHVSSLHGDFQQRNTNIEQDDSVSAANIKEKVAEAPVTTISNAIDVANFHGKQTIKVVCPSIPIKIKLANGKELVTYMGLDTFSTDCWIDESLLNEMHVRTQSADLFLTTMAKQHTKLTTKILKNLVISDLQGENQYIISTLYSKREWPFVKSDVIQACEHQKYPHLEDAKFQYIDSNIGILVGMNESDLVRPIKTLGGPSNQPYASLHMHGWALNGPLCQSNMLTPTCFRSNISRVEQLEMHFRDVFATDFKDSSDETLHESSDDLEWRRKVKNSINLAPSGHYQIDLPFKNNEPSLPNNRSQVLGIFNSLRKKLANNADFRTDYVAFMEMMQEKNFVEKIPLDELQPSHDKIWYLMHHGVYHKRKRKLRVVFNCSMKFRGISLNDQLLQGPSITSGLLGVLLRFRQESVAFMADIEKMFFQVKVPTKHADYMRFFWFPNNDTLKEPIEFRLSAHIFGAVSSPSVSNFALHQTASDNIEFNEAVRNSVKRNFYVDDLLMSLPTIEKSIEHVLQIKTLLNKGGFNLTGFVSNSRQVLSQLPVEERAKELKDFDLLLAEDLPYERALGVKWDPERDMLGFKIQTEEKKECFTRRGILSIIFSIYDPLGLVGPVIIPAKQIFQATCGKDFSTHKNEDDDVKSMWDRVLPDVLHARWSRWISEIIQLEDYFVPRCYHPEGVAVDKQLHIFCDGSMIAYGMVAFLRVKMEDSSVSCTPIISKARLVPKDPKTLKTVPRIELNAAKLAVSITQMLHRELDLQISQEYYWTDSTTVLQYLHNTDRKFHTFVDARVKFIRSNTDISQWRHVPTDNNPADIISRGATPNELINNKCWNNGPPFLLLTQDQWPNIRITGSLSSDDPEVSKKILTATVQMNEITATTRLLTSSNDWYVTRLRVAWFIRFGVYLRASADGRADICVKISTSDIRAAERVIYRFIQRQEFGDIIAMVPLMNERKPRKALPKLCPLRKLQPVMDGDLMDNLIRVDGRIRGDLFPYDTKFPIILPADNAIVRQIVVYQHRHLGHMGRSLLISTLRETFWIIKVGALIRRVLRDCIWCRKQLSKPQPPLMAILPKERLAIHEKPFTHTGIDCFGPFITVQYRREKKNYGVIFTCMTSRAVCLEVADTLSTESFIQALRRFMTRVGQSVKTIRSDNGTNFVGGQRELRNCISEWNNHTIEESLKQRNIEWIFNPPHAPHYGGIWEREIQTVKKTLNALMKNRPRMSNEDLRTLMCEVECILNNRPLTELSNDPTDPQALTPNHLLRGSSNVALPMGIFDKDCMKSRWKQVQYFADLFWTRWQKEYLPLLLERQKWNTETNPITVGDLVLLTDKILPRNQWILGRVEEVFAKDDNIVREVQVKVSRHRNANLHLFGSISLRRSVASIVLLKSNNDLRSPT